MTAADDVGAAEAADLPGFDEGDGRFDLGGLFDVLSNRRRRLVILLVAWEGEVSISDAAEAIAAVEYGEPVGYQERKRVYVAFYQCHGAALDQSGVVDYDGDATLSETEWTDAAADFLLRAYDEFDDWEGAEEVLV